MFFTSQIFMDSFQCEGNHYFFRHSADLQGKELRIVKHSILEKFAVVEQNSPKVN